MNFILMNLQQFKVNFFLKFETCDGAIVQVFVKNIITVQNRYNVLRFSKLNFFHITTLLADEL